MTIITEPNREQWAELVRRPAFDVTQLFDVVRPIMDEVHAHGDAALREYGPSPIHRLTFLKKMH